MDSTPRKAQIDVITKMDISVPRNGGALRARAIADHLGASGYDVATYPVKGRTQRGSVPNISLSLRSIGLLIRMLPQLVRYPAYSLLKWVSWGVVVDVARKRATLSASYTLIDFSQMAIYAPICSHVVAYSFHNVESELLASYATTGSGLVKRTVARYDSWVVRRFERHILKRGLPVFVVSEHDADVLQRIDPDSRVVVVPNGVSDECFRAEEARTRSVVFVASLDWQPNVDAAEWLVKSVWPEVAARVHDAQLFLIGRAPARKVWNLEGERVTVIPDVASVIPYVSAARVATAPLLSAGGTRLKILEALACGTPVVATPLGALGLESAFDERALRIRAEPQEFAQEVVDLLESDYSPELEEMCRIQSVPFKWSSSLSPMARELDRSIAALEGGAR